jgi:DNA-binding NarL/FixJ family response regulator
MICERCSRITLIPPNGSPICKPSFPLQFVSHSNVIEHPVVGEKNLALLAQLTPEERSVAELVCKGMSNDDIASRLSKSLWTVKRQMYSIFRKLKLKSRTELAMRLLAPSIRTSLWTICRHFLA